jgi:hypothetical protein
MTYGSGSSGYTSVARVKAVIDTFYSLPEESQTSAIFANLWTVRTTQYLDIPLPYIIGGGEANSAEGWWAYLRRLHGSTYNTSTKSVSGVLGLPSPTWTNFVSDRATLAALTTHVSGTTDADHGRRVYEFLMSTDIESEKYHSGQYRELLEAWGARGSSDVGSS